MAIEKQLYERQLELIFKMLLENKTNEHILVLQETADFQTPCLNIFIMIDCH